MCFMYIASVYEESRKMVQINLVPRQEQRHRHGEWTVGGAGEGEGGMNWEVGFDINTLPCVKQVASGNSQCDTGSSAWWSVRP